MEIFEFNVSNLGGTYMMQLKRCQLRGQERQPVWTHLRHQVSHNQGVAVHLQRQEEQFYPWTIRVSIKSVRSWQIQLLKRLK